VRARVSGRDRVPVQEGTKRQKGEVPLVIDVRPPSKRILDSSLAYVANAKRTSRRRRRT